MNATANCSGAVQKVWSRESSCGRVRIKRAILGRLLALALRRYWPRASLGYLAATLALASDGCRQTRAIACAPHSPVPPGA